jgi:putative Holliday junction resolvase
MGVAVDSGFLPAASPEGRVLGIDFGKRRIGMAVSDPTGRIAQGLDTIETPGLTHTIEAVEAIAGRYAVRQIVIGLPVNMDGTEGEMARQVIQFAGLLRARLACEVRTWDERLTSSAAQRALADMGYALKGNKHQVDRIAATMLLQNYLDHVRHTRLTSESGPAEEACPD